MSKRKRVQAYLEQAHLNFVNESAGACFPNSTIKTNKFIKPITVHQKQFVKSMKNNQLTLAPGSSGSGKTLLALFTGIQLINNPSSDIQKLLYIRSNTDDTEEERDLGALPGDLLEKLRPLAAPIMDNLELFMDMNTVDYLLAEGRIEIIPSLMLRGRSFANRFIIIDEAQNITRKKMKTALTRCGETSKMVVIGDPDQCDIHPMKNGLLDLECRLRRKLEYLNQNNLDCSVNFGIIPFTQDDIVRSNLTKFILDLYQ